LGTRKPTRLKQDIQNRLGSHMPMRGEPQF
jgi:hypothetical protein